MSDFIPVEEQHFVMTDPSFTGLMSSFDSGKDRIVGHSFTGPLVRGGHVEPDTSEDKTNLTPVAFGEIQAASNQDYLVSSEEYMDGRSEYLAGGDTPSSQCNTLLGYDYKIRAETLPDAGQSSDTNLDRAGATISWTPINAVGGVGDQSQLLSMDNYMATRSYSPTNPTPTSDIDADFDIEEHDETDDEFSEEGSEFETPEPSRRKSATTGKKISTNGAGVVSINMESPSVVQTLKPGRDRARRELASRRTPPPVSVRDASPSLVPVNQRRPPLPVVNRARFRLRLLRASTSPVLSTGVAGSMEPRAAGPPRRMPTRGCGIMSITIRSRVV
jgi:hypothetical protein